MPKYPAQIDNNTSLPSVVDNLTPVQGDIFNKLRNAVISIETELGVKPSGLYSNVAARLNNLEGIIGNLQIIELDEDLGGTLESPLVIGLQGRPVSDMGPGIGQSLIWNGIAWIPGIPGLNGDVIGPSNANKVVTISGNSGTVTISCPNIMYTGGLDINSLPLPTTSALRATFKTTNGTTGVLNTVTPANKQMIRVLSEVMAVRTDVVGDAAWFLLKAVFLRNGGTLVPVAAPSIVSTGATAGASTWTAVLAANSTAVETQVTGQAGKTIHWSVIREYVEGS